MVEANKIGDLEVNKIILGDCIEELKKLPDNSIDAVITDPPYGLEFMGKEWDRQKNLQSFCQSWATECLRILKPGGYLLAFGGTRTYHRMACGIEDAGFEIRDCIMWLYGSGFPKSLDISKAIDKMKGAKREKTGEDQKFGRCDSGIYNFNVDNPPKMKFDRYDRPATPEAKQWEGWGTALKPAVEPIVVARKPLSEKNVALNVLKWGTGGINIDACRIEHNEEVKETNRTQKGNTWNENNSGLRNNMPTLASPSPKGRFPANVILECTCDEVIEKEEEVSKNIDFKQEKQSDMGWGTRKCITRPQKQKYIIHTNPNCPCYMLDKQSGELKSGYMSPKLHKRNKTQGKYQSPHGIYGVWNNQGLLNETYGDKGGASRFFYCAKASKSERNFGLDNLPDKAYGQSGGAQQKLKEGKTEYLQKGHIGLNKIKIVKNNHPTVKPIKLMEYLIKLVTREGAIVLDPFIGSGTTAIACLKLNRKFIGIDKEPEYVEIAKARIKAWKEKIRREGIQKTLERTTT